MFIPRPDGTRLFSLAFGAGPRSLLAIGGWAGSGELWHPVFGHLPGWRCVSLDHRGSGASRGPVEAIRFDAMVEDLPAAAEALGFARCVLAAESSGVAVALAAALRWPERFSGLVLVGGAWQPPPPAVEQAFAAALRADHEATLQAFATRCLPEPGSEDLREWGLQILRRCGLPQALALLATRSQSRVHERLAELRVPALLLHGTLDVVSPPAASQALAAALPQATLRLLNGLGHVPMLTAPAMLAQMIEERWGRAAGD
jgi:pimeloyl-ACP methyl ester carboxylesterase